MNPKIARISALVIRTERKYNEIHSNAFEFEVLFLLLNEYDVKDSSRRVKISRMNRIELKVNILIFIYTALYRLIPRNPKKSIFKFLKLQEARMLSSCFGSERPLKPTFTMVSV